MSELEDAYRAPNADDGEPEDEDDGEAGAANLYVIALPKLVVLYAATAGAYAVYWFYKQFRARKRFDEPHIWPLARAFFSIFYVHRLFRFIDAQAREVGKSPAWNANAMATLYVVLVVGARVFGRVSTYGTAAPAFALSTLVGLGGVVSLAAAQRVANSASGDPEGKANAGVDTGSVIACIVGAGVWAFLIKMLLLTQELERIQPAHDP